MYMQRRVEGFYLRLRVPADLTQRLGLREIRRSLGTSVPRVAKARCAALYVRVCEAFERIRAMSDEEYNRDDHMRILEESLDDAMYIMAKQQENAQTSAKIVDIKSAVELCKQADRQTAKLKQLGQAVDKLLTTLDDVKRGINNENNARELRTQILKCREDALKIMQSAIENPMVAENIAKVRDLTLASLPKNHIETPTILDFLKNTHVKEKKLEDAANRHIANYINLFARICGNRPLNEYHRQHVVDYISTLEKMKNTYGKSDADYTKSIAEILKETKSKSIPTLSEKTIRNHRVHVRALFISSLKHHRYSTTDEINDMFSDIKLSKLVPTAQERKPWSIESLTALFASPIWTGTASQKDDFVKRKLPGKKVWKDAYWWLPIIALHTCARLEEIAQLQHGDLRQDANGIWFIAITDENENQRLKTKNSKRNIPVHKLLIELGFLDLFKVGNKSLATQQIFPELKPRGREDKLSQLYSNHFSEYRKAIGLSKRFMDFHAFRHTAITKLCVTYKVPALTVARISGHDPDDPDLKKLRQTNDYSHYEIHELRDVLDLLDYEALGVKMAHLRR